MSDVVEWIEQSPYGRALGVSCEFVSDEAARLELAFRETNSNPGGALHGGVAASLSLIGAQAVARTALGPETGPWHTVSMQINYLAAAISEAVTAEVRLLRRGKELCFVEVKVRSEGERAIADAILAVRGRCGAAPVDLLTSSGDGGEHDPGPMGERVGGVPFIGSRGIEVELMRQGRSRLRMKWRPENGDLDGGTHEGAALALLDTAGAMAAWAVTGPGRFKASTPSIQAQILGPPPAGDLVAYARVIQQDNEIFWCDVEVAAAADQRICARGTVLYRIVTGSK